MMEERYLNFNNFIKQRAIQINKFNEALQISTCKRSHQALPKSVRRRAMSHNRYRIPLKMRKQLGQELVKAESMQKIPKCRKSIRKKHRLIISYKARNSQGRWLNTHLWAAKRMRMKTYCGYKIAQSPSNKSFRSSYRHFRHNSCLVDCSYFQMITIRSKLKLNELQIPPQLQLQTKIRTEEKYQIFYEGSLVDHDNGTVFICPILIFFESNQIIRCIFDPFCLQEVEKIKWDTQNYDIEIGRNKTELYLLLGPQSLTRVKQALIGSGLNISIELDKMSYQANNHKILYINSQKIQKNESFNQKFISKPITQKIVEGYDINQNKKMREQFFTLFNARKQTNLKSEQRIEENKFFWQFYQKLEKDIQKQQKECQDFYMKITNRSKYTHKRKNKLTKQQKKKVLAEEQMQSEIKKSPLKQQQNPIPNKQNLNNDIKLTPCLEKMIEQTKTQEFNPIMITPFVNLKSKQKMLQGCFVFCSARNSCKIWRAMTHTDVKVIGRKEIKHLYFQASVRFYPDDYINSSVFQRHNQARALDSIKRFNALPPQKRTNFMKINSPFPFCFSLPKDKTGIAVKIQMVSRGKCPTGSYICSLENEDYDTISKSIQEQGKLKSIVCQQKPEQKDDKTKYKINGETFEQIVNNTKVSETRMKRKIIGFVTTGGFKYSESKQGGLGYLYQPYGECLTGQQYVLIRTITSKLYYLGVVTLND